MNESKSLNTILTLTKIAKVLSMITLVLMCIALVGCILAVFIAPNIADVLSSLDWDQALGSLSSEQLAQFKETFGSLDAQQLASFVFKALICSAIICAASAAVAFLAYRYFKNVLAAGTPFTFKGSDELKTLGIVSLVVELGSAIISSIALGSDLNISLGGSLAPGIAFLVVSVIFRHGAELREKAENAGYPVTPENGAALPFGDRK